MTQVFNRTGRIAQPAPDWRKQVKVGFAFKTGVIESRDGTEQREASRQTARVEVQFDTLLTLAGIHRHRADLAESQHTPFILKSPWRQARSTAPVLAGAQSIEVAPLPFWAAPGARLVLQDGTIQEAACITPVSGDTVTLEAVLVNSFPAGSVVAHAYSARVNAQEEFKALTSTVWTGGLKYDVDPGSDPQTLPTGSPQTFEGREVFLGKPNWRGAPKVSFAAFREIIDPGFGVVETANPHRRPVLEERLQFTAMNATEIEDRIAFFLRCKGKRGAFWMPTWQLDLVPLAGTSTSTTFDVAGEDAYYGYRDSDVYSVVAARWDDGSVQLNRVEEITLPGNTRLRFADAWDRPITPDTVLSWSPLWRFATDRLEVSFDTTEVAEMTFAVRSLPNKETP